MFPSKNLPELISYFKPHSTTIHNNILRVLYKLTAVILIIFSILVTLKRYEGSPIDCMSRGDVPKDFLDNTCMALTTFSLSSAWEKEVGAEIPYPGIEKYSSAETREYHTYYGSVGFVLFLQAIFFYLPQYIWNAIESGRMKKLILALSSPFLPEDAKVVNRKLLVECTVSSTNNHGGYFKRYAALEIVNFANVVGQICFTDIFLSGKFLTYGLKVMQFTDWDSSAPHHPMANVFPRLAKCVFHKYGSSGDVQRHDAMCALPINSLNEKIYIFLWFWFFALAILSGLVLLSLAATVFFLRARLVVIRSNARFANQDNLRATINKCRHEDWFLLYLLSENLDPYSFRDLINEFASKLDFQIMNKSWESHLMEPSL